MSFFKTLFGSKNTVNLSSLNHFKVDFHSHLIPAIDDGVKTKEEAITIIKKLASLGYEKIITTPHIQKGVYNNNATNINAGLKLVKNEIKQAQINIRFEAAAEYFVDEFFINKIETEPLLTFGNNHILIEQSFQSKSIHLSDAIFKLGINNYKPILAHPERYFYMHSKNLEQYKALKDKGVLLQLNLFSLVGKYGKQAQQAAEQLINANLIDFVGTDLHNPTQLNLLDLCLKNKYVKKLLTNKHIKNNQLL